VLYGEKSKTFLPSVAVKIKKLLPQAILKKMPNTGHFIPMEHPAETAELVLRFIQEGKV
jgi:pimeloyl-ACP methyl ester carboxylesterase